MVASEVRQLAQRAGEASKEIDAVISRSDQAVSEGVAKVSDASASLEKISEKVVGVSQRIEEISVAISEQTNGVGEINKAVSLVEQNTQKQAASFEEITAASSMLSKEAEGLKSSTLKFKTGHEASTPGVPTKSVHPSPQAKNMSPPANVGSAVLKAGDWQDF